MRWAASPGCANTALAGQPGSARSVRCQAAVSVPGCSCRSMRVSAPWRPNRSCAAPMSITASGAPPAATVPATCTGTRCCRPVISSTVGGALPRSLSPWGPLVGSPSACSAAVLRNTVAGANSAKRSAPSHGRGMSAGAMGGSSRASAPSTRSGVRAGLAELAASIACATADSSSSGLARATCGSVARRSYSASGRGPCMARSSRSGWPLTARTACENSSSADALITCTANASATPSITAATAAALRQGWWRRSCQEKVRSRASMGCIVAAGGCVARHRWCVGQPNAVFAMREAADPCGCAFQSFQRTVWAEPCDGLRTGWSKPCAAPRRTQRERFSIFECWPVSTPKRAHALVLQGMAPAPTARCSIAGPVSTARTKSVWRPTPALVAMVRNWLRTVWMDTDC